MERTFTFLFTDIEGSTRLWEEHPDRMSRTLRWHDEVLQRAIEGGGGRTVKSAGDGFLAVFETPTQGARAALDAQAALDAPSPDGLAIRVRMALHTGEAEARAGDFYGPTLNRAARLSAIGHGGQILLSQAARDGLGADLAAQVRDRGSHRLRDLSRDEQVYELTREGGAEFGPLRSLSALRHNLPVQLTSFIGRETELADVRKRAQTARLLTLTGPGGCGKTRLMLQAAGEMLTDGGDGVWLVELAPLSEPSDVTLAVAQAVGIREAPGVPLVQSLCDGLKSRRLLLLLDNCEHLLQACAELVHALLSACPQVSVIATSREPLGIWGEQVYRVPSLPLPPSEKAHGRRIASVEETERFASVRLFVERTRQVRPDFHLSPQTSPAVASICRRLDGIPFAIELAAARARSLPVAEINDRLDNRFRLLTGGSRTALPRQQTLQAMIDWSYDLLTEQETRLLRSLSVFAGGWRLEAAHAVGADALIEEWEILDLTDSLLAKSLIQEDEGGRYRMLETVRQYATDRLRERGDEADVRARHLRYFARWAEGTDRRIDEGGEQREGLTAFDADHDNLRAAMQWGEQHPDGETVLLLGRSLFRYWEARGFLREGLNWIERLRAVTPPGDPPSVTQVRALHSQAALSGYQGRQERARRLYEDALVMAQACGDPKHLGIIEGQLGVTLANEGDLARGVELQASSARRHRENGYEELFAVATGNLGVMYQMLGRWNEAQTAIEDAIAIHQKRGNGRSEAIARHNLGRVYVERGDLTRADQAQRESLRTFMELATPLYAVHVLEALSYLRFRQNDPRAGAQFAGAAHAARQEMGSVLSPVEAEEFAREQAPIRDVLGESAYLAAFAEGAQWSLADAAHVALTA